ncbi:MAG: DUF2892 domain-containing protein [Pyrinomonadaceae bacterium]|nr:DUF2892 domain-containing protein [Pyrinomonadaceae bacterium]
MQNIQKRSSTKEFMPNLEANVGNSERVISAVTGGALIAYGLNRRDTFGVLLSLLGGGLAFRGTTGHCEVYKKLGIDSANTNYWVSGKVDVQKSVTINKSPAELFSFWENFENLPQFMNHLESVTILDDKHSHWKAKAPLGYTVEWDAEITNKIADEKIEWRSTENADIPNIGKVEFTATANRGTEVKVHLSYIVPGGKLTALAAKIFGEEPSQQVAEDLRRFKRLMETGLIMKIDGQPSGREKDSIKTMSAKA